MAKLLHPFINLEAALFFCGIDRKTLAKRLNISYGAVLLKLRGENEFTLKQMEKLRDLIIQEYKGDNKEFRKKIQSLDYLFYKEVDDGEKL